MLTHTEARKGRAAGVTLTTLNAFFPLGPNSSSPSSKSKNLETRLSAIHEGLRLSDHPPAVLILSHTVPFSQDPEFIEGWVGQGWDQTPEGFKSPPWPPAQGAPGSGFSSITQLTFVMNPH